MAVVMIVEDEALIRFALADELIACGHMVIECCNVLEALAVLGKDGEVDAVVTDVDMPGGLSGLDLSRLLAATRPSLPLWVTSGREVDISALGPAAAFLPGLDAPPSRHDRPDHHCRPAEPAERHRRGNGRGDAAYRLFANSEFIA